MRASKTVAKGSQRRKRDSDQNDHGNYLNPGGRVLVQNMSERGGPGKL